MSTQTFDLHLRFTVTLDVGEATITPVAAAEPDDTKDPALALVPPEPKPKTTRTRTDDGRVRRVPAQTTTPAATPSDTAQPVEPKADGGDNNAENPADAGGPP